MSGRTSLSLFSLSPPPCPRRFFFFLSLSTFDPPRSTLSRPLQKGSPPRRTWDLSSQSSLGHFLLKGLERPPFLHPLDLRDIYGSSYPSLIDSNFGDKVRVFFPHPATHGFSPWASARWRQGRFFCARQPSAPYLQLSPVPRGHHLTVIPGPTVDLVVGLPFGATIPQRPSGLATRRRSPTLYRRHLFTGLARAVPTRRDSFSPHSSLSFLLAHGRPAPVNHLEFHMVRTLPPPVSIFPHWPAYQFSRTHRMTSAD